MDQDCTPVLDAIERIRREGTYTFSLPGHRFGRGIDDRTAEVLSRDTFAAGDLPARGEGSWHDDSRRVRPELETFRVVSGLSRAQPSNR
jgi:arginine/lysine/ornithine decarboxylase